MGLGLSLSLGLAPALAMTVLSSRRAMTDPTDTPPTPSPAKSSQPSQAWLHYLVIAVAVFVGGIAAGRLFLPPPQLPEAPTDEKLADRLGPAIESAASYFDQHIDDKGRFQYYVFADRDKDSGGKYNILRHAGSVYSISMLNERGELNEASKGTLKGAAGYLRRRYVHQVEGLDEGIYAVFSQPKEERLKSQKREAKLGGSALGVIALLAAREVDSSIVPLEDIQSVGRFLVWMQGEDGKFRSKYSESLKFEVDFNSLYYPGEAILALTRLYQADKDTKWLMAAAKGMAFLVEERKNMAVDDLPKDHWLLIAGNELLENYEALSEPPVSADAVYKHMVALGTSMLNEQRRTAGKGKKHGSFIRDGRSTPNSTRVEGLAALHELAGRRGDSKLQEKIRPAILATGKFILRCQVTDGPHKGGIVAAVTKKPDIPGNKKFNHNQGKTQIDYVQHAMSALIGLEKICASHSCP